MGLFKKSGESWSTRLFRLGMNLYPMYWGTGGRIQYIAADFREVRLSLGLNPFTYNYVGTIFGGSMFAASDPFLMVMLYKVMGKDRYVVWDKAAKIRFRRPGKGRLTMRLQLSDELVERIRQTVAAQHQWTDWLTVQWLDREGAVVAELERELFVADKVWYSERQRRRGDLGAAWNRWDE